MRADKIHSNKRRNWVDKEKGKQNGEGEDARKLVIRRKDGEKILLLSNVFGSFEKRKGKREKLLGKQEHLWWQKIDRDPMMT